MIKTLENRKKNPFLEALAVDVLNTSKLSHVNFRQKLLATAMSTTVILHGALAAVQKCNKSVFCVNELHAIAMSAPVK